ncbi:hypothetical protein [Micromonospora endophytica]|uniref:Uncharacterized protein n=1 Tax=Micromonospora endophytica TaxID=515350 RepID=A0A2W2CN64_9ACTN|nr:hypothetical protein [Micromonospora endophytica]PZF99400.1 hypothetical protein C1I93_05950 [Micromonospora endophytica]RIW42891.1 hypothetical protein D3H59_21945 [Micromonospora endophytica]BCJ61591.1 hypothetical protein Jiend_50130 [Micromonospora endophytica]
MTQPFVYVDAPTAMPYRYGLFSAAAVVDPADQREFHAGVEWEPQCVDAPAPTNTAAASEPNRAAMELPDGVPLAQSQVIRLYTGLTGVLPGRPDLLDRARRAMGLVEQQSLEHYVWSGDEGTTPHLAAASTPVLAGSDAAPVALETGVGLLESHLAQAAGVLGVLWAPRWTAGWCVSKQLTRLEGPRLVAPLGNPVAFVQTTGIGPDGDVPDADEAWLYATGPVMVRRSAVFLPRLPEALDRTSNEVFAVAERFYTVGWGCTVAAVKVKLPGVPA